MKVGILFPNTETSRFLAIKLLDSGYDVAFFCPESLDLDLALNIIYECNMVGQEQDSLRSATHKSFVVAKYDLSDCDVIVIPWLNIKDKDDADYSNMCLNLFRLIKHRGIRLAPNAKIVFGLNVAGLAAAAEWGKVWPEYKNNILVTCSVYRACQKIWGPDVHALPVRRSPVSIVTSDDDGCESMKPMKGKWMDNSFVATESRLLYDLIDLLKKNQPLHILGIVGKFSSPDESQKFGVPLDTVFWLPTDDQDEEWFVTMLPKIKDELKF